MLTTLSQAQADFAATLGDKNSTPRNVSHLSPNQLLIKKVIDIVGLTALGLVTGMLFIIIRLWVQFWSELFRIFGISKQETVIISPLTGQPTNVARADYAEFYALCLLTHIFQFAVED